MLPPIGILIAAWLVFMVVSDLVTYATVGYAYFPTIAGVLVLFVIAPLAAVLSAAYTVIVSARSSDVRAAQQLGSLGALPFVAIYLASELKVIEFTVTTIVVIAVILVIVDATVVTFSRRVFARQAILTRWR